MTLSDAIHVLRENGIEAKQRCEVVDIRAALVEALGFEPAPLPEKRYASCPHCHEEISDSCEGCDRMAHTECERGEDGWTGPALCAECRGITDPDGSAYCPAGGPAPEESCPFCGNGCSCGERDAARGS